MARRRFRLVVIAVVVLLIAVYVTSPYARAASLIVRAAGIGGPAQTIASLQDRRVTKRPKHVVPTRQTDGQSVRRP